MAGSFRYRAFISYSHRDRRWGRWLLRAIETYRVPRRLVGRATFRGRVPRRLAPVFRDRDELPAAEDLSAKVREALEQSEFLIIVCSPHAAASRWVNQEILEFKRLRGEDHLLAVIVDGEPFASERGGDAEECFPPALRRRVGPDGALTEARAEPVAADLRREGDGRRLGRLKLIAGMLGLSLDHLIQRDLQRRHRRVTAITAASLLGVLAMGALTWEAVDARREAEHRRGEAEGLIEFMLTDLRKKLEPVGRLDVLDAVGEKAIGYYAAQRLVEMPDDSIGRRARAFHLLGEIDELQGDLDGAQEMFHEAWDATAALLARTPDSPQRIYDHAQSVYWLGYLDWRRGNYAEAEAAFRSYKDLAERLVVIEPENLDYVREVAYVKSNLGTLLLRHLGRPNDASYLFLTAHDDFLRLLADDEADIGSLLDLADSHAWLADVARVVGTLDEALNHRMNETSILERIISMAPDHLKAKRDLVGAQLSSARILYLQNDIPSAISILEAAIIQARFNGEHDPDNIDWKEQLAILSLTLARFWAETGEMEKADRQFIEFQLVKDSFPLQSQKTHRFKYEIDLMGHITRLYLYNKNRKLNGQKPNFRDAIEKIYSEFDDLMGNSYGPYVVMFTYNVCRQAQKLSKSTECHEMTPLVDSVVSRFSKSSDIYVRREIYRYFAANGKREPAEAMRDALMRSKCKNF